MKGKAGIFLSVFFLAQGYLFCQEKTGKITVSGYVSSMNSAIFDSLSGPFITDHLVHNRLNFKGFINNKITVAAEFRNRLFTGDMVNPSYSMLTAEDHGLLDLSWNIFDRQSFFLNTTIDRLWFDYRSGKFQATIGRQRINWGQTLVWNPNDIFNVYSFFDFDYIERPGSDAVRLQFFPGSSSAIELAVKADFNNEITAAGLYRFNTSGYDIQFLGGYAAGDIVIGTGWSGSVGSFSFRGEGTWFQPARHFTDTAGTGMITAGFDRVFSNNSSAQLQIMLSNNPADLSGILTLYTGNLSTKDIAFSKFSAFGQYSYPVTPLFTLGLSSMWFPDLKGYFTGFSADYSVAENVDLSVLWQHFNTRINQEKIRMNLAFLRVKFSF